MLAMESLVYNGQACYHSLDWDCKLEPLVLNSVLFSTEDIATQSVPSADFTIPQSKAPPGPGGVSGTGQ